MSPVTLVSACPSSEVAAVAEWAGAKAEARAKDVEWAEVKVWDAGPAVAWAFNPPPCVGHGGPSHNWPKRNLHR